jgi:NAD(P)H-binding
VFVEEPSSHVVKSFEECSVGSGFSFPHPFTIKARKSKTSGNSGTDALEDVEAVIQTLGVDVSPRAIFEHTTLFSQSTRILVDAMKAAGVKRLIVVTGLGAGREGADWGRLCDFLVTRRTYSYVLSDRPIFATLAVLAGH